MTSKFRQYLYFSLCMFLLTSKVCASGLEEALKEHLKDTAHDEESETVKLEKGKGEKDHHIDTETKDTHSNKFSKENDESKFLKKDQESKVSSEKDAFGGYNTKQDKAEDHHTDAFKRGHKKGHHKQGYQNTYHKDESSNKSSFFDDLNDEGDQAGYTSKANTHDNQDGRSYEGSHNNGQQYSRNDYRGRANNRYGDVGDKHATHRDYGRNSYLDNSENYNKYRNGHDAYVRGKTHDRHDHRHPHVHYDPGWDWNNRRDWDRPDWDRNRDWGRNRDWDRSYHRPGHYDHHGIRHDGGFGHGHGYRYGESRSDPVAELPRDAPVPVAPMVARRKQTITIYEDPRYAGKENGQLRREEGDYIELDYQPSSRRYSSYDSTYYNVPARSAESSKINRLVYNRRQ
ncbi:bifunctional endo-1,4-beta-xylanase XylA-like [Bicyclus anynana]|uniref:Bifunctional endo-1,4-beta-xylanase XylA-like n=1 Tax=Bicyclus anynana TaxID=110368 RepID=A0A6J1MN84_BICAN|nr:bifunctional endo-1,4-beta-xylanase XylA-like [Bicyclus anynana]